MLTQLALFCFKQKALVAHAQFKCELITTSGMQHWQTTLWYLHKLLADPPCWQLSQDYINWKRWQQLLFEQGLIFFFLLPVCKDDTSPRESEITGAACRLQCVQHHINKNTYTHRCIQVQAVGGGLYTTSPDLANTALLATHWCHSFHVHITWVYLSGVPSQTLG